MKEQKFFYDLHHYREERRQVENAVNRIDRNIELQIIIQKMNRVSIPTPPTFQFPAYPEM